VRLDDYDYRLPQDLIAQVPAQPRSSSRLLEVGAELRDRVFSDLPGLLFPGDLLVFNDTRVVPARLSAWRLTGGRVEILLERPVAPREALVQLRSSKRPREGETLSSAGGPLTVRGRDGDLWRLALPLPPLEFFERFGAVPLPPYVAREPDAADRERYQAVFARTPGAVAAPTASLHFDAPLLAALEARGVERAFVTLHVGAGTFQPIRVEDPQLHRMHAEWVDVPPATCGAVAAARNRGSRVVAVGTTVVRALETAAARSEVRGELAPFAGDTALFIHPGHTWRAVDALVTNFHLPRSTLLILVSAFAGRERVLQAYAHAVDRRYRFFSYGDAMFLERARS
jgi:S-adenosylmethionine:tRNA ribosyltransferase-isomerase